MEQKARLTNVLIQIGEQINVNKINVLEFIVELVVQVIDLLNKVK